LKSVKLSKLHNCLIEIYYKSVPHQFRRLLSGKRRDVVFKQAMERFLTDPGVCAYPGNPVLIDLIYGWGNEAWSARDEYLAGCISHALVSNGPILECGSGLSTILLGAVAKRQGQNHWVLEHKPEWAKKVQNYLDSYNLGSTIITKPLKNYGEFSWYDTSFEKMPTSFSLVACDGPPRRTKGGRYGLVPVMRERLMSGCVILLDDAGRKEELDIAKHWEAELSTTFRVQGITKPYIKMTVA
jgi:Methyltransferase domain